MNSRATNVLSAVLGLVLVTGIMQVIDPHPASALGAPTFVQTVAQTNDSTSTTISKAFTSNTTAGNAIVLAVSWGTTGTVTCSDTLSDSFTTVVSKADTDFSQSTAVCVATNIVGGADTVKATFSSSSPYRRIIANEYSGIATASALDAASSNYATATTATDNVTSGSTTTTVSGDLIFGAVMNDQSATTIAAGAGYTQRNSLNSKDLAVQDQVQTTAGAVASTQTFGAANEYVADLVALRPRGSPTIPSYVQSVTNTNDSSGTSISKVLPAGTKAGDALVVAASWGNNSTLTCSDTLGNTFTTVVTNYDSSSIQSTGICVATNIAAGSDTVKATFSHTAPFRRIVTSEYNDVATTSAVDASHSNVATATTATDNVTSGSATTTANGDLIFGAVMDNAGPPGNISPGTGFAQWNAAAQELAVQDKVQTTAGSVASTQTFGATDPYVAAMVALKPAVVSSPPTASFTESPSAGDVSLNTSFNAGASTAVSPATITGYSWAYGDGGTGTGVTSSHTYTTVGAYIVPLTVTDSNGQTGNVTHTVNVYNTPTAAFTPTVVGGANALQVNVDASASTGDHSSISSYAWNFGDGGTGSGVTSSHTYSTAGTYTISLTVTDGNGGTGTLTHSVTVHAAPTAAFTVTPTSGGLPLNVSVNGSASSAVSPATITGYSWAFGDGATATGATASHSYTSVGMYTITLTVTDSNGNTAIVTHTVSANPNPTASFTPSAASGDAPFNVSFNASASTPVSPATISSYAWNFGDGGTGTGVNPSHNFTTVGTYTVALTITDSNGATATTSHSVNVYNPPVAAFDVLTTNGSDPLGISVYGGASSGDHSTIATYAWNYGDGTTASGATNTHNYSAPGAYTISLTVTDTNGGSTTITHSVTVYAPPTATFAATPTSGSTPLPVSFDASGSSTVSGATITDYAWDFGDGNMGDGVTVSHTYSTAGTFTATLTITDSNYNTATFTRTITTSPSATLSPSFTMTPTTGTEPLNVAFDASASAVSSPATITSYTWNFGDGISASGVTTTHVFSAGTFTVTLTIGDSGGDMQSATQTLTVSAAGSTSSGVSRASASGAGAQANDGSSQPSLSGDGRFVAFSSYASNLVAGDTNGNRDVFVRNLVTGDVHRIVTAQSAAGVNGNTGGESFMPSLDSTGRYVAYLGTDRATSTDVVADAFVYDIFAGTTTLISAPTSGLDPDGPVTDVSITSDGTHVAFVAYPNDGVSGTVTDAPAVFIQNLSTGTTTQETPTTSAGGNYSINSISLSSTGGFIAFASNDPSIVSGGSTLVQVYRLDTGTGAITPVSVTTSGGAQSDSFAGNPTISGDGNSVAFESSSVDLVSGDNNGATDVFVRNMTTDITTRASVSSTGGDANGGSYLPKLSADGSHVLFTSEATDLNAETGLSGPNVFERDLGAGTTALVSKGSSGPGDAVSFGGSLSSDGSAAAFESLADNLTTGDTNRVDDVFVGGGN